MLKRTVPWRLAFLSSFFHFALPFLFPFGHPWGCVETMTSLWTPPSLDTAVSKGQTRQQCSYCCSSKVVEFGTQSGASPTPTPAGYFVAAFLPAFFFYLISNFGKAFHGPSHVSRVGSGQDDPIRPVRFGNILTTDPIQPVRFLNNP